MGLGTHQTNDGSSSKEPRRTGNSSSAPAVSAIDSAQADLSPPLHPGDTGVLRALADSTMPAAPASSAAASVATRTDKPTASTTRPKEEISPMTRLVRELAKPIHLGRKFETLATINALGIEAVVEQIHQHPPTRFLKPDVMARFDKGPWLPLLERKDTKEILMGVCAEEENGNPRAAVAIALPIQDDLLPLLKRAELQDRVTFVLLTRKEYIQLRELVTSEPKRRTFLGELNQEQSARANFFQLLDRAVTQRATDIHIEPQSEKEYIIRLRVDGVLVHDGRSISAERGRALVRAIKVMGQSTSEDARKPWDGAINPGKEILDLVPSFEGRSLRISIIPSVVGESAALRILQGTNQGSLTLNDLQFEPDFRRRIEVILSAPYGMFLVTGPTGSGKTTTLAAALRKLNTKERKIVTLEEPVEQRIPGIIQSPMNAAIDYRFADGLRATLRHDPEVILVGEVRDAETAKIMTQGANTGHLMLSTIHTNDSISVFKRLRELGIDESQISASLLGVLSQRLVRCLCGGCKEKYDARAEIATLLGTADEPNREVLALPELTLFRQGSAERRATCGECAGRGYRGRVAIPELWVIGEEERDLISRGETGHKALFHAAVRGGMVPMSLAGFNYVRRGITDVNELLDNVIRPDEIIAKRGDFVEHLRRLTSH